MNSLEGHMERLEEGQRELRRELKGDMRALQQSIVSLNSDVHKQTRWLVGAITVFGTILSALLIIGQLY